MLYSLTIYLNTTATIYLALNRYTNALQEKLCVEENHKRFKNINQWFYSVCLIAYLAPD